MADDIYHVNLKAITGHALFKLVQEFVRFDLPLESRPREGYLLDFKAELPEKFIQSRPFAVSSTVSP